jgi:L,D-transpeptidase catalytic domain
MHRPQFVTIAIAVTLIPLSITSTSYAQAHTKGREVAPFTRVLKPGDYVWYPKVAPAGPVVILVSLPDQLLYVYRNGVRIGRSTASTGKPGKRTPTGVFTVLQKKVRHESSIYKGAQMPHMQRLTWTGVAMHAGNLPGYPASAGCVRLPVDFAANLYSVTTMGVYYLSENGATNQLCETSPTTITTASHRSRLQQRGPRTIYSPSGWRPAGQLKSARRPLLAP